MTLSSNQLEAFFAVAQTGHFTKAARKLNVTQSALSQRILNLESELETTLFIRDRAGLRLTSTGYELLRYCQNKETLENEFLSSLKAPSKEDLTGVIRVAGFSSIVRSVLMPALSPLISKHPLLQVQCSTKNVNDLLPLLKRGEADFIICDRRYDREELELKELGQEKNVLVEKLGYSGPPIYLDHDEQDEVTTNYLKLSSRKINKVRRYYFNDVYGLLDGVKLGYGRAVLPRHLVENERHLNILDPKTVLNIPVVLHYFRQPYYSKLHHAVVSTLLKGSSAWLGT